jgi:hypothetical protein
MTKEVKAGDAVDFKIGDKTLTVEAVPYGNVKKVFKIVFDAIEEITASGETPSAMRVPKIIEERINVFLPLLFRTGKYPFLNPTWIDENMTINDIRSIIETAIKVNGLDDFFAKMGNQKPAAPQETIKPTV